MPPPPNANKAPPYAAAATSSAEAAMTDLSDPDGGAGGAAAESAPRPCPTATLRSPSLSAGTSNAGAAERRGEGRDADPPFKKLKRRDEFKKL